VNQGLKKQNSPHDHFIKGILKYEQAMRDLPKLLPIALAAYLSPRKLKLEPASYIDQRLAASHSDLLFSCEFQHHPGFVYLLFEHQSKIPARMPLRVGGYSFRIVDDWAKAHPGSKTVPAVIPIVIYQGKRPWNAPTELLQMTELPAKMKDEFRSVLPSAGFLLVDLNRIDIEALRCGFILKLPPVMRSFNGCRQTPIC
jgi:predicted transposase YdaD